MDNNVIDSNNQVLFHPINEGGENITMTASQGTMTENKEEKIDDKKKVIEHIGTHYKKYLFGLGVLGGFVISLTTRVVFNSNSTSNPLFAGYEVTPEVEAITIFNQMDAIAHEKDNFFHQSGKIYTRTGDTLFHKYDTMFHVLDNAYHTAVDTEKKLLRAQRLARFIKIQNELFAATEYVNKEEDKIFNQLDQDFSNAIAKIATNKEMKTSGTGSTGTTITIQ